MEEYLTTQEIASLLKVNEITVRRWILRGWLPAIRFGKVFRIKKENLEKYGKFNKKKRRTPEYSQSASKTNWAQFV